MTDDNDQPESLVLRQLRYLDIKIDRVLREIAALKQHSVATNETVLALRKDVQNVEERIARTETRLDLRGAQ